MWQFAQTVDGLVGGLPRARGAGHRRQRLALQPDRRPGDPPDAGGRRARRHRRRREAHPVRLAGRRPEPLPARPHRARARRIRLGAGRARAPRRPAARRPARGRARPRRAARRRRGGGPAVGRARPRPRAAWPRRSPRACCASASARASGSTACSSATAIDAATALFSESSARVLVAVPREEDVKFAGLCAGRRVPALRLGVTDADERHARGAGPLHDPDRTSCAASARPCSPPPWALGPRPPVPERREATVRPCGWGSSEPDPLGCCHFLRS